MERVKAKLREIPDFPKPGIVFKDITPVLCDPKAFEESLDEFERCVKGALGPSGQKIDKVVAVESRGFIFGAPLALRLKAGLVLARKPGKLPAKKITESFKLEYGSDTLEMHEDAIRPGERVLIIDDVLATGGTMEAVERLVSRLGGETKLILFMLEIPVLQGGKRLKAPYQVIC